MNEEVSEKNIENNEKPTHANAAAKSVNANSTTIDRFILIAAFPSVFAKSQFKIILKRK